jgi:hypothetical protein
MLGRDKHSSLLGRFVSYKDNKVLGIQTSSRVPLQKGKAQYS